MRKRPRPRVYDADATDCTPTDQEDRIARKIGGKRQPGSGSSMYAKSDVDSEQFLVECKMTGKKSISVKKSWLNKISREALAVQKFPALAIEIVGDPDPVCENDWVLVPVSIWSRLVEGWSKQEE